MIVGISGKIGSGKDTVGSIIQYLTSNYKETHSYEEFLTDVSKRNDHPRFHKWQIKKFAGKLKQIVALLTGCTVEDLESQEFKNKQLPPEWDYVNKWLVGGSDILGNYPKSIETYKDDEIFKGNPKRFIHHYTYRDLLQKVGTEALREKIHENVHINALFADYKPKYWNVPRQKETLYGNFTYYKSSVDSTAEEVIELFPNWLITDMRFPNELKAVKDRGGFTIRVARDKMEIQDVVKQHPSETALDEYKLDYFIKNNGTIEELVQKVREILIKEKII